MKDFKLKLVIASGKGGVGKSMLASTLVMLFAKEYKVVAVDCDVDAPNLHLWLGQDEKWDKVGKISVSEKPVINFEKCIGCRKCVEICSFEALSFSTSEVKSADTSEVKLPILNQFFCEGCGACEVICPQKAIKMEKVDNAKIRIKKNVFGFPLISAQLDPGETGSGKIVEEIKNRAQEFDYDLMILDSPAGIGCPVIAAVKDANFAVLVTEPTPSGLSDLKRVLTVVGYFQIPFGVVINKWDINLKLTQRIEKKFRDKILGKIGYDRRIFGAIVSLTPIVETELPVKEEIVRISNVIAQFPSTTLRTGIARSTRESKFAKP